MSLGLLGAGCRVLVGVAPGGGAACRVCSAGRGGGGREMPEENVEFVPPDLGVRQRFVRGFCPTPASPEYKLEVLRAYRQWSGAKVFVETGTYRGYTTSYMQPEFEKVYTIELHAERVKQAREKFADCPNVKVIEGNSAEKIVEVLAELDQPAMFWLDSHACGADTAEAKKEYVPILDELGAILDHRVDGHKILVDDVRYFVGAMGYPTMDRMRRFVAARRPDWVFDVAMDITRIHPRR